MKYLIVPLPALLLAAPLSAGGLAPPISPAPPLTWEGVYAGVYGYTRTTETVRTESTHRRACVPARSGRWRGKCDVSDYDHANSPELLALGPAFVGHPVEAPSLDESFRYDNWHLGVWAAERIEYTTFDDTGVTRTHYNADNVYLGEDVEDVEDVDQATGYGVLVGVRQSLDSLVIGLELSADGEYSALDAQVGLSVGPALVYGFVSADQSYGAGADYMVTDHVFVGTQYRQSDDTTGGSLRVGWKF